LSLRLSRSDSSSSSSFGVGLRFGDLPRLGSVVVRIFFHRFVVASDGLLLLLLSSLNALVLLLLRYVVLRICFGGESSSNGLLLLLALPTSSAGPLLPSQLQRDPATMSGGVVAEPSKKGDVSRKKGEKINRGKKRTFRSKKYSPTSPHPCHHPTLHRTTLPSPYSPNKPSCTHS
jgi:hypothetical protein